MRFGFGLPEVGELSTRAAARLASGMGAILLALAAIAAQASPTVAWTAIVRGDPLPRDAAPPTGGGQKIAVDGSGNTYLTGYADDGLEDDIVTIKYGPTGAVQWRAYAPGSAAAIAVDQQGYVYVTGSVRSGYSVFDTHDDLQTLKYAPDGTELWRAVTAAPSVTYANTANAVAVDASGSVYVTGFMAGNGLVTVKYDASGVEQWRANAIQAGQGVAIAVDSEQNVFVLGSGYDGAIYGYLTIRYDAQGGQVWSAVATNPDDTADSPVGLALDPGGDVVVTGTSWRQDQTTRFFTVKYERGSGNEQWRAMQAGSNPDPSHQARAHGITVDASGNAYVTGSAGGTDAPGYMTVRYAPDGTQDWLTVTASPSAPTDEVAALAIAADASGIYVTGEAGNGSYDFLTLKYDFAGDEVWRAFADNAWDGAEAVAVDAAGNVAVSGFT